MYIVLASKSPRRREILMNAGYHIKISVSNVDENVIEVIPEQKVAAIAKKKGLDVYNKFKDDKDAIIISADTIVVIDDEVLGKPKDKDEARIMISKLQGKTHKVYTAVYIKSYDIEQQFVEKTDVMVSKMTNDEIESYINTPEPYDKAGGYAIQGIFAKYISTINGDYFNVMGLPINKLKQILSQFDLTDRLQCPNCKSEVNENDGFCNNCGSKLNIMKKKKVCSKCHKTNHNNNKFCEFCGNDLSNSFSFVYGKNECPVCNHINEENVEYCSSCGALLKINKQIEQEIETQKEKLKEKDLSDTAFIMAILGIITTFTCCGFIGTIFSILACIFGGISLKRGYRGKAKISVIMGGIITVISILLIILLIIFGGIIINIGI